MVLPAFVEQYVVAGLAGGVEFTSRAKAVIVIGDHLLSCFESC